MNNLIALLTLIALYTYIPAAEAGSTTLVTYYPAPSGHYDTLQLTPGIEESKACGPNSDGVVFIGTDGEIKSCSGNKIAGGNSSWKLSDSPSAPGTKTLMAPSSASTVYITQRVGVGLDPNKAPAKEPLSVAGPVAIHEPTATTETAGATAPYSSRIVFYLNSIPKLYAGVTQTADAVLSFMGPAENAENSFFTIDNASGNIGVGNNAPAAKLDVAGLIKTNDQVQADKEIITGEGLYLGALPITSSVAGLPSITAGTTKTDSSITIAGGVLNGVKTVKIADYLEVNNGLNVINGNVGIGLDKPQNTKATLEVNGKIYATTPDDSDDPNAVVTKEYLSTKASACFNRFCSYNNPGETSCALSCPADYPQLTNGGQPVEDDFISDNYVSNGTSYKTHVRSIVCCKR